MVIFMPSSYYPAVDPISGSRGMADHVAVSVPIQNLDRCFWPPSHLDHEATSIL